jgi:DNA (cytosine-5)-methyltransferase 1
MVARCDGDPIRWPEPTHGTGRAHPYVTAADSIDWSTPCPSIFTRKKPLADATCRRIARGIKRYVIEAAEPFIVPATHHGSDRINGLREPLPTITAAQRGELMLVAPTLIQASHGEGQGPTQRRGSGAHDPQAPLGTVHAGGGSFGIAAATLVQRYGEREGQEPRAVEVARPMPTIVPTDNGASLVTAFLEQANTGLVGHDAREPLSTIVGKGCTQRIVAANLVTMRNNADGQPATDPLGTVCAGTVHHGVVECRLSPEAETSALRVAAFLVNYYGNGTALDLRESIDTITTRDRLALVTVTIRGTPYVIVDIGLRMLKPVELYRAQGFPADYIIDRTADGRLINGTRAVRMVGNSVSPPPLAAIARANLDPVESLRAAA